MDAGGIYGENPGNRIDGDIYIYQYGLGWL